MARKLAAAGLALLAAAYIVPYTALYRAEGWSLYAYWLLLGVGALIVAWAGSRR